MIQAILIVLASLLLGRGALRILYKRPAEQCISTADSAILGGILIIGLAEVAHMGTVLLGLPFSGSVKIFVIGLVLLLFVSAFMVATGKCLHGQKKHRGKISFRISSCIFLLIVLIQLITIVAGTRIYLNGDMTVETVNSFLSADGIYRVNPMTGQAYTSGIPMRLKILCLPTLYAIICEIFGLNAMQVVWNIVPALTLLGCYAAFYTVAKTLFPDEEKKQDVFMIIVALLLWAGDYMYGMDGFAVQYAGYRGVSIRIGILLPYTFGLILRKKWRLVFLCIMAEACIVWTLYGMGACVFVTVGMILTEIVWNRFGKCKDGEVQDGKEGGV